MNEDTLSPQHVDCLVIGGGINGTAFAADAAGRGLSVTLCEKNDLGSGTSNWSTKLVHGGLRYLEQYEFRMVRHALIERDILLQRAPFIIKPLPFILPHQPHLRARWIIRAGLYLYDHLAKSRFIPKSTGIKFHPNDISHPLKKQFKKGFCYYDCQTDDHRLVILNALSAQEKGASILTHTKVEKAEQQGEQWLVTINDINNKKHEILARTLINASGPWMNELLSDCISTPSEDEVTLIKGSHIIVKKLYTQSHAFILQIKDGRIIFTIPFHKNFTLIGTTDIPFTGNPEEAAISLDEENYLIKNTNAYFKKNISNHDIVWSYSGVRALQKGNKKDPKSITREYTLSLHDKNHPPLLNILGGKITTHRRLAEDAVNKLTPYFNQIGSPWTTHHPLPGGNIPINVNTYKEKCEHAYPWLPKDLLDYYIQQYGSRVEILLEECNSIDDLGHAFSDMCYAREIDYLMQYEWARSGEDILWRRTKHGLTLSPKQQNFINTYCKERENT